MRTMPAFDRWLLRCLINSAVPDVSGELKAGKAALEGSYHDFHSESHQESLAIQ